MHPARLLSLAILLSGCTGESASAPNLAPGLLSANGTPGGSKCWTIELSPDSISIAVGQISQLSDTVYNKKGVAVLDAPVSWFAALVSVAAVNQTGIVTGVSPGVGWILASCATGAVDSTVVVVTP